jgi:hypothetical protein
MCQAMAGLGHINRTSRRQFQIIRDVRAERHSDDVVDAAWRDSANTLIKSATGLPGPGPVPVPVSRSL